MSAKNALIQLAKTAAGLAKDNTYYMQSGAEPGSPLHIFHAKRQSQNAAEKLDDDYKAPLRGSQNSSGNNPVSLAPINSARTTAINGNASQLLDSVNYAQSNISGSMYEDVQNKNNLLALAINRENNKFNAEQAELQRAYSESLANTAHQRQVQDLKAAGLNPILSANAGAAVPQGATASNAATPNLDHSIISALAGLASSSISANAAMTAAATSAAGMVGAANAGASATRYAANQSLQGQKAMAEAAKYGANMSFFSGLGNIALKAII